jgi:transposase-like protein
MVEKRRQEVVKLASQNIRPTQIARILEVPYKTIWRDAKELGITFPKREKRGVNLTSEQLSQVKDLAQQGLMASEAATIIGITARVARVAYQQLGIKPPGTKLLPLSDEQNRKIIELFDQNWGTRRIARFLDLTRECVKNAFDVLGLDNSGRKTPRVIDFASLTELTCADCKQVKPVSQFRKRVRTKNGIARESYECYCLDCEKIRRNEGAKRRAKKLRQTNPNFVIRSAVSFAIWKALKNNGSGKSGESCLRYLPYTIDQLRQHLESLFEPWMTWGQPRRLRLRNLG